MFVLMKYMVVCKVQSQWILRNSAECPSFSMAVALSFNHEISLLPNITKTKF